MIKGWDVVVRTMKMGEECAVKVHSKYGYGKKGGKGIPGGANLYFVMELEAWC